MIFRSKFLLIVMMSLEMAFLIMSIFKYLELEIKRTGDVGRPFIVRESEEEALSCAVLTQLCPTLCDPMDCSPPGSSVHGDSPGKNTGVGCHALPQGIFPT